MKLTKQAIKALESAIAHWDNDMIKEFKNRKKTTRTSYGWEWEDTGELVKCYIQDCDLCKIYYRNYCKKCPYSLFYKRLCTTSFDGHWHKFNQQPCLRTANAMKKSLQKILDSQEV